MQGDALRRVITRHCYACRMRLRFEQLLHLWTPGWRSGTAVGNCSHRTGKLGCILTALRPEGVKSAYGCGPHLRNRKVRSQVSVMPFLPLPLFHHCSRPDTASTALFAQLQGRTRLMRQVQEHTRVRDLRQRLRGGARRILRQDPTTAIPVRPCPSTPHSPERVSAR